MVESILSLQLGDQTNLWLSSRYSQILARHKLTKETRKAKKQQIRTKVHQ